MRRVAALLVAAHLVTALPVAPASDHRAPYKEGVAAAERNDWATVENRMRAAIRLEPNSKGRGPLLRRYLPHYYLGIALAQLGTCREAVTELDEAERQGPVVKAREFENLERQRTGCRNLIQEAERAKAAVGADLDSALASANRLGAMAQLPPLSTEWNRGTPSFGDQHQDSLGALDRARSRLAAGEQDLDLDTVEGIRVEVGAITNRLEILMQEVEAHQEQLVAVVDGALGSLRRVAEASARDTAFIRNTLTPLPDELAEHVSALETQIQRSEKADRRWTVLEIEAAASDLRRELNALREAFEAPPETLMEIAASYFVGDYERASQLVNDIDVSDPRIAAHACLFRAASLHALFLLREGNEDLLRRAEEEAARCHTLPERIGELPPVFSPTFDELYKAAEPPPPVDEGAPQS